MKNTGVGLVPDLISAPFMANELNIQSTISTDFPKKIGSPYWNLVAVQVTREDGSSSTVTGSVFGTTPHVVQLDEYVDLFAFKPTAKYLLTFRNEDNPGVVLKVEFYEIDLI